MRTPRPEQGISCNAANDDDTLVIGSRAGLGDCFGTLYDRHYPALYAYAWRLLADQADAEDAAHETLCRAWSKLHQYQAGNFRGWLFAIAHRICLDKLRQRPAATRSIDLDWSLAGSASTETAAVNQATVGEIAAVLAQFPVNVQTVVSMKLSGFRYAEIALVLGKSEAAVAQDYLRAVKKVAERLHTGSEAVAPRGPL